MWLGFLELTCLSALAIVAAIAIGLRVGWNGRAELFVGASVLAHALVTAPILVLGWFDVLYRSTLGATSALVSLVALASAFVGRPPREFAARLWSAIRSLVRLPFDAFAESLRPPNMTLVGLLAAAGAIGWTAWASYMTPSSSWDGLWYHETIVGFALQNHGFRFADLPAGLTYVNSFPRICEMMNLWFVAFTDRRLIEVVNTVMSPTLVLAIYVIVRRYADRATAMGWATVLLLVPAVVLQMRSTYIDLHIACLMACAMYFTTRPVYRLRDACVSAICLALLVGTKYHALMWTPFLGIVHAARVLVHHGRRRPLAAWGVLLGTLCLVALVAGPVHVRNWLHYHNPVYPIAIDIPKLDIHWPGTQHVDDIRQPFADALAESYTAHTPGKDFFDTKVHSYGFAIPWIAFPVAIIALPFAVFCALGSLRGRNRDDRGAKNMLLVVLPMLATAPLSPALWLGRYNIHVAAALVVAAAWGLSQNGLRRLGEGARGAAILVSIMLLWWVDPGWGISREQLKELAKLPSAEARAVYAWPMYAVPTQAASARERELGDGDIVVLTDDASFPSLLWNDRFTNRLVYVHFEGAEPFLRKLGQLRARWAMAIPGTGEYVALREAKQEWEEVGIMTTLNSWTAFRRSRSD